MLKNYPTLRFILQRGIWYFLTFLVAVTINFFLPRFGADPIDLIMSQQRAVGRQAEQRRTAYMKQFGLVEQRRVAVTVSGEFLVDANNQPLNLETLVRSGVLFPDTLAQLWNSTFTITNLPALQSALRLMNEKRGFGLPGWIDLWGGCPESEPDQDGNFPCLSATGLENFMRTELSATDILSLPGITINRGVMVYTGDAERLRDQLGGFALINEAYLVRDGDGNFNLYQWDGDVQQPRYIRVSSGSNDDIMGTLSFLAGSEVLYEKLPEEANDKILSSVVPIRRSLFGQYIQYLVMLSRGDMGTSLIRYPQSVGEIVASAVPWTIALQFPAILFGWIVGNVLGVLAAYKRGMFDKILFPCALLTNSIPMFAFGMLLVYVFAEGFGIFPSSGGYAMGVIPSFSIAFISSAAFHYVLPFLSLFPIFASGQATGMRTMGIYELGTGYVKYAKTLGVSENRILMYIFRNAMLPQLTGLALGLGTMVGGALITEMIFSYPGLGSTLLSAVQNNDYPLIQGGALLVMITVLIANLIVDLLIGFFDPRVKAGLSSGV
ncbi:MAG: ABC transporter permease [Chitinivibrionia bacterium]|nr:ABC transporter permease [Chitinivibrionia bacterium]